jgi:hypothetical protein
LKGLASQFAEKVALHQVPRSGTTVKAPAFTACGKLDSFEGAQL